MSTYTAPTYRDPDDDRREALDMLAEQAAARAAWEREPCPDCDDTGICEYALPGEARDHSPRSRRDFCDCPIGREARQDAEYDPGDTYDGEW